MVVKGKMSTSKEKKKKVTMTAGDKCVIKNTFAVQLVSTQPF